MRTVSPDGTGFNGLPIPNAWTFHALLISAGVPQALPGRQEEFDGSGSAGVVGFGRGNFEPDPSPVPLSGA